MSKLLQRLRDPTRSGVYRTGNDRAIVDAVGGAPLDVVAIDVVPVVFGRGKPYFGARGDAPRMLEDPDVVIQGDRVLHLRYRVRR